MTPRQKILWLILASCFAKEEPLLYPCDNVEQLYADLVKKDQHWDAEEEVRQSGVETKLPCEYSRHYESKAVAAKLPDGSWVGWTYFHGGGKHGQPNEIPWINDAYDVICTEETKTVIVQTFIGPKAP